MGFLADHESEADGCNCDCKALAARVDTLEQQAKELGSRIDALAIKCALP